MNQDLSTWRNLLSRNPISKGPRITDGAGDISSANWTIPQSDDFFKSLQVWIKRILQTKLHTKVVDACKRYQSDPFISEEEILPFLQDIQNSFPSTSLDLTIPDHQRFRLKLLHSLLLISKDPDPKIATLLQEGIPSGAFSQLQPVGLWEPNSNTSSEYPDLVVCYDNWTSANHNPDITRKLIRPLESVRTCALLHFMVCTIRRASSSTFHQEVHVVLHHLYATRSAHTSPCQHIGEG